MLKKVGTIIALQTKNFGELYIAEGNAITPHMDGAKTFRASAKVIDTIKMQAQERFSYIATSASTIERWSDSV